MPDTPENIQSKKPRKSPKHRLQIKDLLALKTANPSLTNQQMAKLTDTDPSAITKCFQRYGIDRQHLDAFKTNRADIMAGIQETVASTFTVDDIKSASVRDRAVMFGVFYDKERLERGQSTSNVAVILASAAIEAGKQWEQAPQDVVTDSQTVE